MDAGIQNHLLKATEIIEQQVDAEIEKLDKLEEDDFDTLRQKRMSALKKAQQQKQDWLAVGHGQYTELANEKDFFDECKKSKKVVCHFFRISTERCKIVDMHMSILAQKHIETRFLKINAEKCPFLVERLKIMVLPTICVVKEGKTTDYIVGFDELGGVDDFPTEMLAWRLGKAEAISYQGDPLNPPAVGCYRKNTSVFGFAKTKKTIKDHGADDSSDEEDW